LKEINPNQIKDNIFKLIGKDWLLITAGTIDKFNTMTAGWGAMGILWGKEVCFVFVRPSRYTYQFMEKSEYFTLCFFEEKYRDILNYCGSHSGKNTDKIKNTGLKPVSTDLKNVYFAQSRLVLECKKIYFQDINPEYFLDKNIEKNYSTQDYHRIYV